MMKSTLLSFIVLTIALVTVGCVSGTDEKKATDYSDQKVVKELIHSSRDDYYLVDVRTPEEYASGHIPKAINIPVSTISDNPPTMNKDALIIVYCRSGSRSARAKDTLEEMGYTNVYNVGGIIDWTGEIVKP